MNTKLLLRLYLASVLIFTASIMYANETDERVLTPFERLSGQQNNLTIDVKDADANELIPRILERTGVQYTFIRSQEERLISVKTKAEPILVLETIAFAAGFNIHRDGGYWVIHPIPLQDDIIN